jgi:fatty-acyl-CoA synthase
MPMMTRHYAVWPPRVPKSLDAPERTLFANLAETAARYPDRKALVFYGREWTYAALLADVERLAGWMQSKAGIGKGDRVLICVQNSPHFVIGYFATLRADAVVVPVNPMSKAAELEHLARDTGARLMLGGQEGLAESRPLIAAGLLDNVLVATYADRITPMPDVPLPEALANLNAADVAGQGLTRWQDALDAGHRPGPHLAGPDDLAVIPYSSGTTGQPKGCMHSHRTVMDTAWGGQVWNPSTEEDVHLATLPFFHVTGMQGVMNGPVIKGGCIIILLRWNRTHAARLIQRFRVTRWRSITTMAIDLVNDPDVASYDLSSLKSIGGGGASMPEAVANKLHRITGLDYIEGYGLSETMAATHTNPVHAPMRQCLGIPMFGVDSRILSVTDGPDFGKELGPNEVGEIVTHGPQVFLGYWNNPDASKEAFLEIDGKPFFRTGDLGYYDENGYFFMVDRVKRMINASGFKVWPAEVEALMHRHPDIVEACVIASPDPRRGETVKACIVASPAARDRLTGQDVIDWCKTQMAAYKCPTKVEFVDSLPKSGAGKVLWRALTEAEFAPHSKSKTGTEP